MGRSPPAGCAPPCLRPAAILSASYRLLIRLFIPFFLGPSLVTRAHLVDLDSSKSSNSSPSLPLALVWLGLALEGGENPSRFQNGRHPAGLAVFDSRPLRALFLYALLASGRDELTLPIEPRGSVVICVGMAGSCAPGPLCLLCHLGLGLERGRGGLDVRWATWL